MTCKHSVIEWNEPVLSQVHFNIMIRNFFKIFPEFTLFCFLFVAKSSFGNFQWRMSQDPTQPAICSRSWNGEKKTQLVYAGKHSVNETTRNDVVWRKVAMGQCHNPHFANLLRFAIAWRGRDRFRSQRNHRFFRLPNFMYHMSENGKSRKWTDTGKGVTAEYPATNLHKNSVYCKTLLVVYREFVNLIGYITRRLSAVITQPLIFT